MNRDEARAVAEQYGLLWFPDPNRPGYMLSVERPIVSSPDEDGGFISIEEGDYPDFGRRVWNILVALDRKVNQDPEQDC